LRYLLAAERAVKMGIRNADALQALLNDVRRDVKDFLRANKYIRYLESVKNPPNPHPYGILVSRFPYSRLIEIRRKLQEALAEATTRDTNAEPKHQGRSKAK
jgi:predicted alpha-1,6-mannanase (GH76 family)